MEEDIEKIGLLSNRTKKPANYERSVKYLYCTILMLLVVGLYFRFGLKFDDPADVVKPRDQIIKMTKHAWKGYFQYASDSDEVQPLTKSGYNWTSIPLYTTAVDSLDTLFLMGLEEEYAQAKELVKQKLHFDNLDFDINVFETNIRILGGLLGAYELDPDEMYIKKAVDFVDRVLPAYDTATGIPVIEFNPYRHKKGQSTVNIASVGSLQLELQYLSDITGNPIYQEKALHALEKLVHMKTEIPGLFPKHLDVEKGEFIPPFDYTVGAEIDSFYEYLLKLYLATGEVKFREWYSKSADAILKNLIVYNGNYVFPSDLKHSSNFEHLACFVGGMFTTGALAANRTNDFEIGKKITETCAASYEHSRFGLGGEKTEVIWGRIIVREPEYHQRPEVIESVFYMYRYSHDKKYRKIGKQMISSLEKHCRDNVAYHGLEKNGTSINRMESFMIAETLKYLFLLFSDDDVVSLDKYVLNTEAHPLSVRGAGRRYDPRKWVKIE